ncbi:MAG: hypothetical protein EOO76_07960 [Novosphingobium sp.]|nr:MAG: hypothetical protein EOO76_07960 [Novosphingobium sp.]
MIARKNPLRIAALSLALAPLVPIYAQSAPAAKSVVPTAPPAWTVTSDTARGAVGIMASSKGGTVQFLGGCSKGGEPGLTGAFSSYQGTGLRTDGQVERVAFYARGEDWQDAFSVRLRYLSGSRSWEIAQPLSPVFFSSFSRGATLAVVNSRNEEIFTFDLTGSTAAVKAMRTVCAIPVQ